MHAELERLTATLNAARTEVGRVIIGQANAIEQSLIVILTGQHALIEGVPGVAKTLLVRTLGRVLGCDWARIQFTPDLMPADITGTNVFNLQRHEFNFVPGPVFTTFLLADEINRAPAKTQSALLQAMQERRVTVDRTSYPLSPLFTVFATQNPIEFEGTYPLPEAQKDRFMLKIVMTAPDRDGEMDLARRSLGPDAPEVVLDRGEIRAVATLDTLAAQREALAHVVIRDELVAYGLDIVRKTRAHESILVGAGPRATQAVLRSARALALLRGRDFVTPDDVREMTVPVLEHRLILRPEYELEGLTVAEVIGRVVEGVPVPR
jgi:MoxR-like ATPase